MYKRLRWMLNADKISPEVPLTYWMLNFPTLMRFLCKKKFGAFGKNSEIRIGSFIDVCSRIYIGNNVTVRPGSFIYADPREGGGKIIIEDKVLLGPQISIFTNDHRFDDNSIPIFDQGYTPLTVDDTVIIKEGSWIGACVTILRGVTIGKNSVVAANSVVNKNVPDNTLVGGCPAKVIRNLLDPNN